MKIKVFDQSINYFYGEDDSHKCMYCHSVDVYILFNDQNVFEFVSDVEQADIVAIMFPLKRIHGQLEQQIESALHKFNKDQILINMNYIMHIDEVVMGRYALEEYSTAFDNANIPCKVVHLHTDISFRDNIAIEGNPYNIKNFVYTDFLFNRSHTLHFNNELISANWHNIEKKNHWYNYTSVDNRTFPDYLFKITPDKEIIPTLDRFLKHTAGDYELTPKIFVAPNNSRRGVVEGSAIVRSEIRKRLNKFLYDYQGYIGDVSQGTVLVSQQHFHDDDDLFNVLGINGWGFSPPHNDYYNTSTLSIYAETILFNDVHRTRCITEKTFTPLCKAHFIMPFGAPGTVATLKDEYGFKFPDWIDYSYDNIGIDTYSGGGSDEEIMRMLLESKQWEAYLSSVKNVCEMDPVTLYHYKRADFNKDGILLHNRNIMKNFGQKHGLGDPKILQEILS